MSKRPHLPAMSPAKPPAEVAGIAVDAGKRPVDRDLQATVTVGIGDFKPPWRKQRANKDRTESLKQNQH